MITKSALNAAASVAQELSDMGITVLPNGDHELANLNRCSLGLKDTTNYSQSELNEFTASLTTLSDNPEHHATLVNFVDTISKVASAHISHDHNVVNPMVVEFSTALASFISAQDDAPAASMFEIVRFQKPLICNANDFLNEVQSTKVSSVVPTNYVPIGVATPEQVSEFLKFPQADLNEMIGEWLLGCGGFVEKMCIDLFGPGTGGKSLSFEDLNSLPVHKRLSAGILLTLVATKLSVQIPDNVNDMGLGKYQQAVEDYKEYGCMLFTSSLILYNQAVDKGYRLILDVEQHRGGTAITVPAESYDLWLKEGGKPEVLFGCVLVDQGSTMHRNVIDTKTEKYMREWVTYEMITRNAHQRLRGERIRNFVYDHGMSAFDQIVRKEQAAFYKSTTYLESARARLKHYLSELTEAQACKVYDVGIAVVAGCGYFNTNSVNTLRMIHDLAEANPDITPRDAATIAAFSYIADFVTTLIGVKKVGVNS